MCVCGCMCVGHALDLLPLEGATSITRASRGRHLPGCLSLLLSLLPLFLSLSLSYTCSALFSTFSALFSTSSSFFCTSPSFPARSSCCLPRCQLQFVGQAAFCRHRLSLAPRRWLHCAPTSSSPLFVPSSCVLFRVSSVYLFCPDADNVARLWPFQHRLY